MIEEKIEKDLLDILREVTKATKSSGGSIILTDGKRKVKITREED